MDPASRRLPVKMTLKTNVPTLPRSLQLTALAIDRGWESRARMSIGCPPALVRARRHKKRLLFGHIIPARVKADSFWGFRRGASQIPWWRAGGSPCGQGLRFAQTMMRPGFED